MSLLVYLNFQTIAPMTMAFTEKDEIVKNGDIVIQSSPSDNLVFAYQSSWMKRLLKTYGNEICLLDATYKTTRYALPLFFMVLKTNVDYEVVGAFVCEGKELKILCQH